MDIVAEISGWLGAVAVLIAYLLFSIGRIPNGWLFQAANLVGSAALLVNGFHHEAWPSVSTNVVWCGIAVWALVRLRQLAVKPNLTQINPHLDKDELLPRPGPSDV
jgi:hypothetical protein